MSDSTIEKNLYIATCAGDSPEKAAMPFVMANAALAMDVQATVCLQGNGVYLAQKGYAKHRRPGNGRWTSPKRPEAATERSRVSGKNEREQNC